MSFINSFRKPRLDQVVIVNNLNDVVFRFTQIYQTFKKRNFASAVGSSSAPGLEWNNLPFWYKKNGGAQTYSIFHVPGQHDPHPLGVAYATGTYSVPAEVLSRAQFPLAEAPVGTYMLYLDIGGALPGINLSGVIGGITKGKLEDIVSVLNLDGGFSGVAEAYVIGSGGATALGIQTTGLGVGTNLEIVTGGANDCSELLGFKAEYDNLYDEGATDTLLGTFTADTNIKAS